MFPNPAWPYLRLFDDDQRIIGMDEAIATALSGDSYADKVKTIFGSSLIDYRRLNEGSGTSAFDSSPKAHPVGILSGTSWGAGRGLNGEAAPLFNGSNGYGDVYSAALNTDFNIATTQAFTAGLFLTPLNVGVWSDALLRGWDTFQVDANNLIQLRRTTVNNQLLGAYFAGGTQKIITVTVTSPGAGVHSIIMTGDKNAGANGELKLWWDGVQIGSTQTALGTWAGSLSSTQSVIGATTNAGLNSWSGYIDNHFLANRAATPTEVASLANPSPSF